ncbi:hypothetical protein ABZ646_24160 [Streptomyces sp. NPDC007162]|uniref:hypothetical protein n=1 Tax=Streptomyces sp. NPDC007162 TaxID=3156917 RepID=UPI0033CC2CED
MVGSETLFAVTLSIDGLESQHPAVEEAFAEFVHSARAVPGLAVTEESIPSPHSKGSGLSDLLLLPGTPAVAVAVARMFRLWLQRDRARSIAVTVRQAGREVLSVEASGEAVSIDALERSINQTLEQQKQPDAN